MNPKHRRRRRTKRLQKSCKSKVRYPNQMTALNAAVRTGMSWYYCRNCGGYHLTKIFDPLEWNGPKEEDGNASNNSC